MRWYKRIYLRIPSLWGTPFNIKVSYLSSSQRKGYDFIWVFPAIVQPSLTQWISLSPASFIGKGCLRKPYTAKLSIAIWFNLLLQEPRITDAGLCCESVPRPGGTSWSSALAPPWQQGTYWRVVCSIPETFSSLLDWWHDLAHKKKH